MTTKSVVPDEATLARLLREHFGLPGFRPGQLEAVSATLGGHDSVVILPTGGGKSVTFQLPCHAREFGFTVVICPLIALAKDQVDKCDERGIYAERWNCEVPEARKASIAKDIASEEPSLRLLYTTPESLRQPKLLESLKEACANGTLVSFAVDEAHTVSEWGHDFRPAYLELSCIRQVFPSVPITALTASCTAKVQADIVSLLGLRSPQVVKGSFNRPNIAYQVRHKELIGDGSDAAALEDLVRFIQERPDQGGIIYARLRATCDWLASSLAARDVEVGCYHAGKATDARARVQRDWSSGGLSVVVATIAFGMGVDRADVRWVVHWNCPSSMEGFYQESGRAGRDGLPSLAVMYASRSDLEANHKMERGMRSGAVAEVAGYAQGAGCRRKHVLKFFGEDRGTCDPSKDQLCDVCTDPRAVQRALSQLEQREADQGSKAAVVRARMMGIRVAPGETDSEAAGADDGDAEAGHSKPRNAGATWSRATTYGAAAAPSSDSASRQHQPPMPHPALGSQPQLATGEADVDVRIASTGGPVAARSGASQLPRRPPAIKRALSTSVTSAAVQGSSAAPKVAVQPGVSACASASAVTGHTASPGACEQCVPPDGLPTAGTDGVMEAAHEAEQGLPRPPSCGMPQLPNTRQPQLKRLKPSLQLPFKAPARIGPPLSDSGSGVALTAAGQAPQQRPGGGPLGKSALSQATLQQSLPVGPTTDAPHARSTSSVGLRHPGAAVGASEAGTCGAGPILKGGDVQAAPAPMVLKRRLAFTPPQRVAQG